MLFSVILFTVACAAVSRGEAYEANQAIRRGAPSPAVPGPFVKGPISKLFDLQRRLRLSRSLDDGVNKPHIQENVKQELTADHKPEPSDPAGSNHHDHHERNVEKKTGLDGHDKNSRVGGWNPALDQSQHLTGGSDSSKNAVKREGSREGHRVRRAAYDRRRDDDDYHDDDYDYDEDDEHSHVDLDDVEDDSDEDENDDQEGYIKERDRQRARRERRKKRERRERIERCRRRGDCTEDDYAIDDDDEDDDHDDDDIFLPGLDDPLYEYDEDDYDDDDDDYDEDERYTTRKPNKKPGKKPGNKPGKKPGKRPRRDRRSVAEAPPVKTQHAGGSSGKQRASKNKKGSNY